MSKPCSNATPQAEATDQQIDALVYELYGLMEEEIAVVEGEGFEAARSSRSRGLSLRPSCH
jgi:hypothetical protein